MTKQRLMPAIGAIGTFKKSGSTVRVLRHCDERTYEGLIEVEHVDISKHMLMSPGAFEMEASVESKQ